MATEIVLGNEIKWNDIEMDTYFLLSNGSRKGMALILIQSPPNHPTNQSEFSRMNK